MVHGNAIAACLDCFDSDKKYIFPKFLLLLTLLLQFNPNPLNLNLIEDALFSHVIIFAFKYLIIFLLFFLNSMQVEHSRLGVLIG